MTPSTNDDKLMSTRIKRADGTTVVLTYRKPEAASLRSFVSSIRLRGDKQPSLSLIARRSLNLYLDRLEALRVRAPAVYESELKALERMTAPLCPKTLAKKRKVIPD
jgi:hypothetical protein